MKRKLLLTTLAALSLGLSGCAKTLTCKTYDTITIGGKDYSYHVETKYYYESDKAEGANKFDRVAYYQFGTEEVANIAKAVLALTVKDGQELQQEGAVIKIVSKGMELASDNMSIEERRKYFEALNGECK